MLVYEKTNILNVNLSYLLEKNYNSIFFSKVYSCPNISVKEFKNSDYQLSDNKKFRIEYNSSEDFKTTIKSLGLTYDQKVTF